MKTSRFSIQKKAPMGEVVEWEAPQLKWRRNREVAFPVANFHTHAGVLS
jgi:hypothetical protein